MTSPERHPLTSEDMAPMTTIPAQSRAREDAGATALAPVTFELGDLEKSERGRRVRAQLEHLFPPVPFPMHLGYGSAPTGYRQVQSWRVIPSRSTPRFLVPVSAGAAAAMVTSHNGLRSRKVAATRRLAALAMRPLSLVSGNAAILSLSVPTSVSDDAVDAAVITRQLLRRIPEAASTAVSLRDFHARAKPTVQLADTNGQVVAFAKVASDPATGERVLIEADLLDRLGAGLERPNCPVRLPRVLDVGRCGPFAYSVVAPLPNDVTRVSEDDELKVLRGLKAFGQSLGMPQTMPLAQTALWDDVMARAQAARTARAVHPDLVDALDQLVDTAQRLDANVELSVGAYHGDWVPWNMAWSGDELWVWDLEYGSPQGPLGLDAMRWVFQTQHVTGSATFAEAVAAMAGQATRVLPLLGLESGIGTTLVRLHVIETISTALGLVAAGRGMPAGLDGAGQVMRSLTQVPVPNAATAANPA